MLAGFRTPLFGKSRKHTRVCVLLILSSIVSHIILLQRISERKMRNSLFRIPARFLRKTPLWNLHKEQNATMAEFAGFDMPMIYKVLAFLIIICSFAHFWIKGVSIPQSVKHTRSVCSIFDVSHMLQTRLTGESAVPAIESVCTADVAAMPDNSGSLALFTNDHVRIFDRVEGIEFSQFWKGGILDDLIVNRISNDEIYIVSNASMADQDFAILESAADTFGCQLEKIETGLIAVQGPKVTFLVLWSSSFSFFLQFIFQD